MIEGKKCMQLWYSCGALAALWLWLIYALAPQWTFYENYRFGWSVPFLALYLLYERSRNGPLAKPPANCAVWFVCVALLAVSLLPSRLIYEANTLWRTITWPMGFAVTGITLAALYLAGGRPWLKHFWFAIAFFLVALPWPGALENLIIMPLTGMNTQATVEALSMWGLPAIQHGNVIEIGTGQVGVNEACSGLRSFQASMMISLFLGELHRLTVWRRVFLVLMSWVLAFVCNMGRTFLLTWVCARDGMQALDKWHDPAGTAILVACFLGIWGLGNILRQNAERTRQNAEDGDRCANAEGRIQRTDDGGQRTMDNDKHCQFRVPYSELRTPRIPHMEGSSPSASSSLPFSDSSIAPFPISVSLSLLLWLGFVEICTEGWFRWHESKMVRSQEWSVRLPDDQASFKELEISSSVHDQFRAGNIRSAAWQGSVGERWHLYYFEWPSGSRTSQLARAHWPEICLVSFGLRKRSGPETRTYEINGIKLLFRAYVFEDQGELVHVFHCVWEEGETQSSEDRLDIQVNFQSRFKAAWEGRRNRGQKTLELAVWGMSNAEEAKAALQLQLEKIVVGERKTTKRELKRSGFAAKGGD